MKRKFYLFLRQENAWEEYKKCTKQNYKDGYKFPCPESFISGAFVWENSVSGHDFWSDINLEWYNIIKKTNK